MDANSVILSALTKVVSTIVVLVVPTACYWELLASASDKLSGLPSAWALDVEWSL